MSESVFLVTAKYKCEDTQLGYKKNETYHLKMYRDMYFPIWFCRINCFMNLFLQNTDILKTLKFKLLATYVFLFLQYLAEISRFWINATEPKSNSLQNCRS